MKIRKMLLFSKSFSVSISFFSFIRVIELKKQIINFLFICSCNIFPVIDLNEHINTILYVLHNDFRLTENDKDTENDC